MKKDLKVYNISVEDDEEAGIDQIAILEDPAIEVLSMRFSKEKEFKFGIDEEKQIVAGPIMIPEKLIYRNDDNLGEYYVKFTADVIEKMVEKFNKSRKETQFNFDHNQSKPVQGFIKGIWIIEDPEKDKSAHYGFKDLPVGTAFIEAKIEDKDQWEYIKTLDQVGFSIEGILGLDLIKLIKNKNSTMKKEINTVKKFLATHEVIKKKFNKTTKKFEETSITEEDEVIITEDLVEGKDVEILNNNGEVVTASDGTYVIPKEQTAIEVIDGKIASVESIDVVDEEMAEEPIEDPEKEEEMVEDPEKEEEMAEEPIEDPEKEEEMAEDTELAVKLAELETRLDTIESKLAELTDASPESFKKQENINEMTFAEKINIISKALR